MPRALPWRPADDARLLALLDQPGVTLLKAADQLRVSRSFVHRRATVLLQQKVRSICTPEREEAGAAPLPSGHPISWGAILLPSQVSATLS